MSRLECVLDDLGLIPGKIRDCFSCRYTQTSWRLPYIQWVKITARSKVPLENLKDPSEYYPPIFAQVVCFTRVSLS